jgi:uridine monophosphate synthetase
MDRLPYKERALLATHPLSKAIFELIEEKETNLCLSADVNSASELLSLADLVGPEICLLKTHIDIIDDFTPDLTLKLHTLAKKHRFFLFEDRKFADIGNTVKLQYCGGVYKISSWADSINAHIIPGPGIIEALKEASSPSQGLFLLAQMSSKGNLLTEEHMKKAVEWATRYDDFVIGFISQEKIASDPKFLHLTPGIQLNNPSDPLGQQYNSPASAIAKGSDILIVGRGITHSPNPLAAAQNYRSQSWKAYLSSLRKAEI